MIPQAGGGFINLHEYTDHPYPGMSAQLEVASRILAALIASPNNPYSVIDPRDRTDLIGISMDYAQELIERSK